MVEHSRRGLTTAIQIHKLATDIGVHHVYLVGNKVFDKVRDADWASIEEISNGIPITGFLPVDERVGEADRQGIPVFDAAPQLVECARQIAQAIDEIYPPLARPN